jgi:hypothetical protein
MVYPHVSTVQKASEMMLMAHVLRINNAVMGISSITRTLIIVLGAPKDVCYAQTQLNVMNSNYN